MAFATTLQFTAQNPVTVNWGDGTVDLWEFAPARHLYATRGPYSVTVTDTVHGLSDATTATACLDWAGTCAQFASWNDLVAARGTWSEVPNG